MTHNRRYKSFCSILAAFLALHIPNAPGARAAVACSLGTGYDTNHAITGSREIFGPGMNLHFGGQWTNLYDACWTGYTLYKPDGSVYFEDKTNFLIPDPASQGYQYWSWYNVVFSYAPMPAAMQALEGTWTAVLWGDAVQVCSKQFTLMYAVDSHLTCRGVEADSPYDPLGPSSVFYTDDSAVCAWLRMSNYALNWTGDVRFRWIRPDATLYRETDYDIPNPGTASCHDTWTLSDTLPVAAAPAANYPGTWRIEVYIKDYQGLYELKYTDTFILDEPGIPAISVSPAALTLNCDPPALAPADEISFAAPETEIPPAQSTGGPQPPPGVFPPPQIVFDALGDTADVRTLPVPGYLWRHGCGPTAVGMVAGFYDTLGVDLIPGDADTQTSAVNQVIASQGGTSAPKHYEDYSLPNDSGNSSVLPDRSEWPAGDEHPHDCIADFMQTSWSSEDNFYGWSWSSDLGPAFRSYVNMVNPAYQPHYHSYYFASGTLSWDVLKTEINANRPMVFLVDTDGNSGTDHFVTVVGYRESPSRQYGCLDTWNPASTIRWCEFRGMASGNAWGIYGGWALHLTAPNLGSFTVSNTGTETLVISSIEPETPAPWMGTVPPTPFEIEPGGARDVTVYALPDQTPCTDTLTRLLIYSNDPEQSPSGVEVTVTKAERFGDLDFNCEIAAGDLSELAARWLMQGCPEPADLTGDCQVDLADLSLFGSIWLWHD